MDIEPLKHFIYTNQVGVQFLPYENSSFSPVLYQEPGASTNNSFSEGGGYSTDWRWLNKLAYATTIKGIHKITALVGYESHQYVFRSYGGTAYNLGYPSPNTEYLGNGNTGSLVPDHCLSSNAGKA